MSARLRTPEDDRPDDTWPHFCAHGVAPDVEYEVVSIGTSQFGPEAGMARDGLGRMTFWYPRPCPTPMECHWIECDRLAALMAP